MAHQIPTTVSSVQFKDGEGRGLVGWFQQACTTRNAYALFGFAAIGYSIGVALPLAIARATATPDPYLRIAAADYFYWGIYFYAPVIAAAWLLASAVIYLIAWSFGRKADFGELLKFTAFATGIGTLGTLLSDLVTSPLRAMGVINEQAWEHSVLSQGGWWLFLWFFMVIYVALFCVGYPIAVRLATKLPWASSIVTGVVGFLVFQGFEYIFIR
jgi:hypothetical protein